MPTDTSTNNLLIKLYFYHRRKFGDTPAEAWEYACMYVNNWSAYEKLTKKGMD